MKTVLSKKTLGTETNFIIEDEMGKWSDDARSIDYVVGDPKSSLCIDPLLSLYEITLPEIVADKYRTAMQLVGDGHIPWRYIIPRKEYIAKFRNFVSKTQEAMIEIEKNQYSKFFLESNAIFPALAKSTVDVGRLEKYLQANDVAALRSLKRFMAQETLTSPTYSRVSTKTGRLTITDGPQVLTLKKEFRSIFKSAHPGGSLFEIDFVSLEPRVALNLTERNEEQDDVYQCFIDKNNIQINRDTAKLAVLCALYGAGSSRLTGVLKQDDSKVTARQLLSKISDFFGVQSLTSMLKSQAQSGFITNYFGRPIEVDDARGSMLVNNFLQSTAADLAIAAFSEFAKDKSFLPTPIFIIHDALIIDVHPDHEASLKDYVKSGFIHEQLGRFPLKLKRLT